MNIKALWTISNSMGTVSDLNMLKSIKDMNVDVIAADRENKDSLGFTVTGKKYIIPSGDAPDYIENIKTICHNENITTIIPQYGDELVPLSRNIQLLNSLGVTVLVTPDIEKLSIANNKTAVYDFFSGCSFVPKYRYASDLDEMEKAIFELGYPDKALCMKPASSEGGKGVHIITEEKVDILNEIPGTSRMSWELLKNRLKKYNDMPDILIMEYLPGTEYSVDCVCKDGETIACIPRQRVETSMGVSVESIIEKNEEIIDISKEIIKALNLSYNINIQFKYSSAGTPMLIEINPRVSGSLVANLGAGVNMLELSLKLAHGLPLPSIDVKWGTRMLRYWNQIFV